MIFIGSCTENENYLLKVASTMCSFGHHVDFILVQDNSELQLQSSFKTYIIRKCFKLFNFQSLWTYFQIMWHTLRNIRSHCIYIVEDVSLVPVFKLLGNKVAYYKKDSKYNSTMDAIIGSICLSRTDLILIPAQSKRLRFEKIAVVDPSHASSGMKAISTLLSKNHPKRICTIWMEEKSEEVQGEKERKLEIIAEEHEEDDNGSITEDESEEKSISRTESEMDMRHEENEDDGGEIADDDGGEIADDESDGAVASGTFRTIDSQTKRTGTVNLDTPGTTSEDETNKSSCRSDSEDLDMPALTPDSDVNAEPITDTNQTARNQHAARTTQYKHIFRTLDTNEMKHANENTIYVDQLENIMDNFIPLIGDESNCSNAAEFPERERALQDQCSEESEVSVVLN